MNFGNGQIVLEEAYEEPTQEGERVRVRVQRSPLLSSKLPLDNLLRRDIAVLRVDWTGPQRGERPAAHSERGSKGSAATWLETSVGLARLRQLGPELGPGPKSRALGAAVDW